MKAREYLIQKTEGRLKKEWCVPQKSIRRIIKELKSDLILPRLPLRANTCITIAENNETINITIGARDWSFTTLTGELEGAGTCLVFP